MIVGIDLVQDLRRFYGMLPPPALAPQAGHDIFGKGDSRLHDIPSALDLFLGGYPFFHVLEERVITGLHPDVDAGKARLADLFQLFHGFPGHRPGPGIAGDPLDGGELLPQVIEDVHQVGGLHHEGIAVLEKDLVTPVIQPTRNALVGMALPARVGEKLPKNGLINLPGLPRPP